MDKITVKNKSFPVRRINVPDYGERNISVEALEKTIFDFETGNYKEYENAKSIDESIFFYVPGEKIGLSDSQLGDYVYAMIA